MFYVLSKFVGFFLIPMHVLLGLGVAGILLSVTRFPRFGRFLVTTSFLLMLAVGFLPIGTALTLPLEQRFPAWSSSDGAPKGIVVLGGVIDPIISRARNEVTLSDAAERVTAGLQLALRYPDAKIVFTGGDSDPSNPIEANYAARLFEDLGVARDRIIAETRARSTAENAMFTKDLVAPKPGERWLLVTSAMHMPRAIGAFRKAGFPVEAYPVDYQTTGPNDLWAISTSALDGLTRTDAAVHEWIGLIAYWYTGRTSSFFPGPKG